MKKIITLVPLLFLVVSVFGQQSIDNILKARALTESGKPVEAISLLSGALAGATDSRLYTERAEAYIINGEYSKAINDYNEANKTTPFSGEYGLARIYALKGDAATALYHLELNLKSPYRKSEKEVMLDAAFGAVENKAEWRLFWKREWYSATENSISEIEYDLSAGKIEESKETLSELKKSYQTSDDILYAGALIDLYSGKNSDVIKIISGLLVTSPENEKYLRLLAKAQAAALNPSGASVTYTQLLSSGVIDAELLLLRADCYRKTGENDRAMADIEKYLGFYPENKAAIRLAGKVLATSGDNLKALEYYSKNLKLHPEDPECYIDRANAYFVSRSWDWAIKDYSMSLDLKPGNSDIWLYKGISLLNSGKTEDACHDFRRAMSLGNKQAAEYISRNCIK
jgi:tetratricopeptide (TPR) repeat protein